MLGQDYLLENARFCVQRRELQNAAAPNIYPVPFYDRLNVTRLVNDLWPRVEVLDGDVLTLPRHPLRYHSGPHPGHQAVYVETPPGTTIIAGDAAMNVRYNVRQLIPPGFLDNMEQTMNGLRRLAPGG